MKIIGLTGSIAMGKSTTARMFEEAGIPVYDADAAVRDLYQAGGAAVAPVEAAFPGVVREGAVDREALRRIVLEDPEALKRLNAVVHPLVAQDRAAFFQRAEETGADLVVLDVPLLFETGGHEGMDAVVVATAPAKMQRERVLARPGMTEARFLALLSQQMADAQKRARADFVVDTGRGLDVARRQVKAIIEALRNPATASRPVEGGLKPGH